MSMRIQFVAEYRRGYWLCCYRRIAMGLVPPVFLSMN